jgi:hypothetical protein
MTHPTRRSLLALATLALATAPALAQTTGPPRA